MISKKKMREKVIDIFTGAGMQWIEEYSFFDNFSLESLGRAVIGLEITFDLPEKNRLRTPWKWSKFDDPDDIVELLREAIEYDT